MPLPINTSIVRFAVVGLGHIGGRHAALIAAHPEGELVAACDILPAEKLNFPSGVPADLPVLSNVDDLLSQVEFDVACICTPNGLHADQAVKCLQAGRHVVVEKPLALGIEDCDRIIATAADYDRKVFGVMQNRYSPASAWLKSLVISGKIGDILQVHLDCFWNRDHRYYLTPAGDAHPWHGDSELDGGVLYTQFAHFIDLLCWTLGGITVEQARFANQNHEDLHTFADTGMVHFSLEGGGIGSLNFSTAIWDRNFESTLTVIGSRGTVKLGGQYMNDVRYCHVEGVDFPDLPASSPANHYGPYQGSAANHHFVIDNVIDVLNGSAEIATTAREGRAVVEVIASIYNLASADSAGRADRLTRR